MFSKADFPVPMPVSVVYTFANSVKGKNLDKSVHKEKNFLLRLRIAISYSEFCYFR